MDWIFSTEIWIALLTLATLEIVLGIDNLVFISIAVSKLPPEQRPRARRFGLAMACQVIAPKLRIPSLVLLLPAGFLLGIVAPNDTPATILGPVFPVAVDFVVAIILFLQWRPAGIFVTKSRSLEG